MNNIKQLIMDNLFIVICVAVTLALLLGVIYPVSVQGEASTQADDLKKKLNQVRSAENNAVPPRWIQISRENIKLIQAKREEVIEQALDFAEHYRQLEAGQYVQRRREPLRVGEGKTIEFPNPQDRTRMRPAYTAAVDNFAVQLEGGRPPGAADVEARRKQLEEQARSEAAIVEGRDGGNATAQENFDQQAQAIVRDQYADRYSV